MLDISHGDHEPLAAQLNAGVGTSFAENGVTDGPAPHLEHTGHALVPALYQDYAKVKDILTPPPSCKVMVSEESHIRSCCFTSTAW